MRTQFRGLHAERAQGTDNPAAHGEPPKVAEPKPQLKEAEVKRDSGPALMVEERTPGQPRGKPQKLGDFVHTVPLAAKPQQRAFTAAEMSRDRKARNAHYAQLAAEQQRSVALNRIGEDMKAGRNLSASDVRNLSRDDLDKIKTKGDEQIKQIVQEHEQQRTKERER